MNLGVLVFGSAVEVLTLEYNKQFSTFLYDPEKKLFLRNKHFGIMFFGDSERTRVYIYILYLG
uniref:Uncharacterized protein n=1 Tax=Anguilla anguilla TaxID=7936 RepID=A0A0E9WMH1_ANGAN